MEWEEGELEIQMLKLIPRPADSKGKAGSGFLLRESQLFLARQHGLRNAAACVAWRTGPLRALWRLRPERTPQGPSFIFLMSILEANGVEMFFILKRGSSLSLHDNHTQLAGGPWLGHKSMVPVSPAPGTRVLLSRRIDKSVRGSRLHR